MGGRFGKYGETKRKNNLRRNAVPKKNNEKITRVRNKHRTPKPYKNNS